MIFETHAHYDDEAFDQDREALLGSMEENGIGTIINVCAEVEGLDRTAALMEKYPFIYGAFGIHPDDAGDMDDQAMEKLSRLLELEKAVAVGEIGLDYYWDKADREVQKHWFEAQMGLAGEKKLPFIIHSRDAAQDTLEMMKSLKAGEMHGGVLHCFSYGKEIAREYLNMGLYLGIGGVVTFKNARKLKEVVEYAPLSQLLLETDSPYLAPAPNRGKRNSSLNIPYIVKAISEIKGVPYEEVVETTRRSATELFLKGKVL